MSKHSVSSKRHSNGENKNTPLIDVAFGLDSPDAREVYLCGDFSGWSATALRMSRLDGDGRWVKRIVLPPGRYEYKFLVDGEWLADPAAREHVVNPFGSMNSIVEVQP